MPVRRVVACSFPSQCSSAAAVRQRGQRDAEDREEESATHSAVASSAPRRPGKGEGRGRGRTRTRRPPRRHSGCVEETADYCPWSCGTVTVTVWLELLPLRSVQVMVIEYIRPVPVPARSA